MVCVIAVGLSDSADGLVLLLLLTPFYFASLLHTLLSSLPLFPSSYHSDVCNIMKSAL